MLEPRMRIAGCSRSAVLGVSPAAGTRVVRVITVPATGRAGIAGRAAATDTMARTANKTASVKRRTVPYSVSATGRAHVSAPRAQIPGAVRLTPGLSHGGAWLGPPSAAAPGETARRHHPVVTRAAGSP